MWQHGLDVVECLLTTYKLLTGWLLVNNEL